MLPRRKQAYVAAGVLINVMLLMSYWSHTQPVAVPPPSNPPTQPPKTTAPVAVIVSENGGVDGIEEPGGNEMGFLTLCTNTKTLPGAMVQIASLRKLKTKHAVLVMVTDNLPAWAQQVLENKAPFSFG